MKKAFPKPYWANTSSNSIIRELVERADNAVKEQIENLIGGGTIEMTVHGDMLDEFMRLESVMAQMKRETEKEQGKNIESKSRSL